MIAISELITPSDIYWLTRLDGIRDACGALLAVSACLAVLCGIAGAILRAPPTTEQDTATGLVMHKHALRVMVPAFAFGAAMVFVPTTREAIAIVVVPKIANNEDVQGLGADTVKLAREWLEELRPQSAKDGPK